MSGGGSSAPATSKTAPWEPAQPFIHSGYKQAANLFHQPQEYYQGNTYAPMQSNEWQALSGMKGYAQDGMQGIIDQTADGLTSMLDAPNVASNQNYQNHARALSNLNNQQFQQRTGDMYENLHRNIMPGVDNKFGSSFGSSRHMLERGQARADVGEAILDMNQAVNAQNVASNTQLANEAYGMGLEQQKAGMALAPTIANLGLSPYQIQQQVGQAQRGEAQRAVDDRLARFNFNQNAGWDNLNRYMSVLGSGTPQMSISNSGSQGQPSGMANAASGAMIGSAFGPWGTATGAVLGGLL